MCCGWPERAACGVQLGILYALAEWRLSESRAVRETILTAVSPDLSSTTSAQPFYDE